jgi:hypothetical protein
MNEEQFDLEALTLTEQLFDSVAPLEDYDTKNIKHSMHEAMARILHSKVKFYRSVTWQKNRPITKAEIFDNPRFNNPRHEEVFWHGYDAGVQDGLDYEPDEDDNDE